MSSSFILFSIFSSLGILSSFMVILSKNPIYSVFFLILSFFNVSALLFILRLEFLPIAFLVVYVGAIAVLFLFVIMMLNIKLAELQNDKFQHLFIIIFFAIVFVFELFVLLRYELVPIEIHGANDLLILSDYSARATIAQFAT